MELIEYYYPFQKHTKEPLLIIPIGDIQWTGDPDDVAGQALLETIAYGLDNDAVFIGMGDYIDYASPSNRQAMRAAALYDNALKVHDNAALALTDDLYEKFLKPTKGRWLGLLEGHHFANLQSGFTTDQMLAQYLGTKFLGTSAIVGIHWRSKAEERVTLNIWCHHGAGSSGKPGGVINKLDNLLPDWECDIFLMGHMTKQAAAPTSRIYPYWPQVKKKSPPSLRHKTKILCGTGGYGKAYVERSRQGMTPRGSYVEKAMMRPANLGSPRIRVRPYRVDYYVDENKARSHHMGLEIRADVGG